MKLLMAGILILFSLVLSLQMPGESPLCPERAWTEEELSFGAIRPDFDSCTTTLLAANRMADVAVQPVKVVSLHLARRYRPAGFLADRMMAYLVEDRNSHLDTDYRTVHSLEEANASRLLHTGYYIYALRRIIR